MVQHRKNIIHSPHAFFHVNLSTARFWKFLFLFYVGKSNKNSVESVFFLKCTSNKIFVFKTIWQNREKLDIRVFSGQIHEIFKYWKIKVHLLRNAFLDAILLFPKSFQLEISNFQIESIFPLKRAFNKVRRKKGPCGSGS